MSYALRAPSANRQDYTAAIIDDIAENRSDGKPFFAYLALQAPHDPFQLPAEWFDRYKGRYDQGYDATRAQRIASMKELGIVTPDATVVPRLPSDPAWADLTPEEQRKSARRMALFAAVVENMDENIGKLIDYLKTSGLYNNTLIIFLPDNGPEGNVMAMGPPWDNSDLMDWGKNGRFVQHGPAWAQVSAGPLRIFKGVLSEGGIRTPLIVSGQGVAGGGRISDAMTHVMDIPATILAPAGLSSPTEFEGKAVIPPHGKPLTPILTGRRDAVRFPEDWLGWELLGNRAIREGNWKLLQICTPAGTGGWPLYNLKDDPGETRDFAATNPDIVTRLESRWDGYVKANEVILPDTSAVCGVADLQ